MCNSTEQCPRDRECHGDPNYYSGREVCLHKDLFPLSQWDIIGGCVLFCGMALAATAGIGGGGLNVPVLILLFNFEPKEATVLSNTAVLGNGLSQFFLNFRRSHPSDPTKPLIDWVAVAMLLPAQLGGAELGVIMESIFPSSVLLILSVVLLAFAAAKTFVKGLKQRDKEAAARAAEAAEVEAQQLTAGLLPADGMVEAPNDKAQGQAQDSPSIQYPWTLLGTLAAFWVLYALDYLLQSGQFYDVHTCSSLYWVHIFVLAPIIVLTTFIDVRNPPPTPVWPLAERGCVCVCVCV